MNDKRQLGRDIEITYVSSVAKLGYAILASFESTASHLFNITYNGKRYEIVFEDDYFDDGCAIDPIKTKLSALKLNVGDVLTMKYDYGAGWELSIENIIVRFTFPWALVQGLFSQYLNQRKLCAYFV